MSHFDVTLLYKVRDNEMAHAPALLLYWLINSKWFASLQTACIPKSSQESRYHLINRLPYSNSFIIIARK